MNPVDIERTKLLANALDRASTACLTIGVLAPIAAIIYGASGTAMTSWTFALGAPGWLLAAGALHLIARSVLGGLEQ